jgi:hypothetical protein
VGGGVGGGRVDGESRWIQGGGGGQGAVAVCQSMGDRWVCLRLALQSPAAKCNGAAATSAADTWVKQGDRPRACRDQWGPGS